MGPEAALRLPPGQIATKGFPIVGERSSPGLPALSEWRLEIDTGSEIHGFSWDDVRRLPSEPLRADIHCVTSWSRLDAQFEGIRLKQFLRLSRVQWPSDRHFVRFLAYSARDHDTSLPLRLALEDAWLIHSANGAPLTHEHGAPLRVVTPSRYFYKSLKWLRRIEFLVSDRLGFWERTSDYHNDGRPWEEERFGSARRWSAEEVKAFRDLEDFSDQSQNIALQVSFKGWRPRSRGLQGVQLKACRFHDADLSKVDFSQANLTLSVFHGADLRGAVFVDSDLEGVDFSRAHLAGARFENCHFSATKFHQPQSPEPQRLDGVEIKGGRGLLESEREFLDGLGLVSSP